jgi:predicted TIM-barrel enzyme
LVLTGKSYQETLAFLAAARERWPDLPILVGGGVTANNFEEVTRTASGAIVSSSLKTSDTAFGRFDPEKVRSFMSAARKVQVPA